MRVIQLKNGDITVDSNQDIAEQELYAMGMVDYQSNEVLPVDEFLHAAEWVEAAYFAGVDDAS